MELLAYLEKIVGINVEYLMIRNIGTFISTINLIDVNVIMTFTLVPRKVFNQCQKK